MKSFPHFTTPLLLAAALAGCASPEETARRQAQEQAQQREMAAQWDKNWNQLKVGMSESEARKLLGISPNFSRSWSEQDATMKIHLGTRVVTFRNGKLVHFGKL
jgi:hypothetical protein